MFKKLIILALITLFVLTAATACSSKTMEEAVPPVSAATEQKPTISNTPIVPTTTPETTPSATPTPGETSEKAISVAEFVKRVENGEYEKGDLVLVSGIIHSATLDSKTLIPPGKASLAHTIFLPVDATSRSPAVNAILEKETKVKIGDKITIKGTFGYTDGYTDSNNQRIWVYNVTIQ